MEKREPGGAKRTRWRGSQGRETRELGDFATRHEDIKEGRGWRGSNGRRWHKVVRL